MKTKKITAYKVFNPDWTCKNFKYEIGKTYKLKDDKGNIIEPTLCKQGFHACINIMDCFNYYSFNPDNKVAIVELSGTILGLDSEKQCSNIIKIIKELSWFDVLTLVNIGKGNSGNKNSGNKNSGNNNSGNNNSGNYNSGYKNSGNYNSGNKNSGDNNSGNYNSGNYNSGDNNSGNYNSGDNNSGNYNSGYKNSGNYNSGYKNSGNYNSGNYNSGYKNSGNNNSGNNNSGNYNSGDYNSGDFNTIKQTKIFVFNNLIERKIWESVEKPSFFYYINLTSWISFDNMTDEEKLSNPKASVCDGYLKTYKYKEAWQNAYKKASKRDIELLKKLPNFNASIFEEITGIKID